MPHSLSLLAPVDWDFQLVLSFSHISLRRARAWYCLAEVLDQLLNLLQTYFSNILRGESSALSQVTLHHIIGWLRLSKLRAM